ncbi:NACHT, LRR and PYD domains-containing protein 3-like [Heptranchias perlo]|uniref:NACHT, LRR and PYD domains-containing protein 3-like n=1 Tax=Heptranchias perlo TaxID=212740 RepID=UPI00355950BA
MMKVEKASEAGFCATTQTLGEGSLRPTQVQYINLQKIHNEHKETLRKQCEKLIVEPGDNEGIVSLDRYTDLKIISSPRQRSLLEHELLSRGAEHEKWQKLNVQQLLEKIRIDQLFRSSFGRTSLCGTSVVTGVAGIGKTTMVQKIVHDWAAGKIYQQFNFVFLFKFRELNVKGKRTSLNRMVLDSYPYFQKHLQNVWEEPNNILIIFDGLDEFEETIDFTDQHRNAATEYKCFDPECRCEVSDIVRCLVQGKVLKGCSVLITSRPIGLELLDQAKVDLWVEILGFFEEERGEYFRRFFGNQELADEVFAYVKQNDILYTLCFNPCYCRIICSTLEPLFKRGKGFEAPLPKTVSDLFSNYIASLLNRWGCSVENRGVLLQKIGAMAYEGVCKKKLVFYADDFRRHHLEPSQFTSGFMMEILDEDPSSKAAVHTFPHLTIQEFLAALSFLLKSPPEGIKTILNKAYGNSGGRFEIFLRFLIGLSSSSSAQQLQEKLGLFLESSTLQVKDWLKAQLEEDFKNVHSEWRKRKLLNTFYLLYESQDRKLMREIIGSKNTTDFSGVPLNLMDCRVLATVLEPCEMIEELNLVYCGIEDDQIQRILPVLHKCKTLSYFKTANPDSELKHHHQQSAGKQSSRGFTPYLTVLHLIQGKPSSGRFTPYRTVLHLILIKQSSRRFTPYLTASSLIQLSTSTATFRDLLTDNNLKDSGVIRLWEALEKPDCKIETLELNNNRLTDVCIEGLCSALEGNQSLSALDLNSDVNIRERANCFTFSSFSQLENLVAQRKNLKLIR